jgi:hypothetical protein
MAHGRKRWLLLAAPATTLVAGVAAWAALSFNLGFTGTVTGQDATVSAKFTSATALPINDSHCAWSVDASGKLVLTATKVPSGGSVACTVDAVIDNSGSDVDLRVQRFDASSTVGAATPFMTQGSCGAVVPARAPSTTVTLEVKLSAVPVSSSGTLTGSLTLVSTGDYVAASCNGVASF